jgi:hypothetical protein
MKTRSAKKIHVNEAVDMFLARYGGGAAARG